MKKKHLARILIPVVDATNPKDDETIEDAAQQRSAVDSLEFL